MLGPLVFVLTLSGFLLLVVGERMGLSAALGAEAARMMLALALAALGLGSVTSRFERFATASRSGRESLSGLGARVACLLVMVLAYAASQASALATGAGFVAGFLIAHLGQGRDEALPGARLARLAVGAGMVLLMIAVLPAFAQALGQAGGLSPTALLVVPGVLAALVLLPGGATGAGRVQRLALALAVALALVPALVLLGLALFERGDPLALETLSSLRLALPGGTFSLLHLPPGALLGLAAGFAARGPGSARSGPALAGLVLGLVLAVLLVGLQMLAQEWLARIVTTRIIAAAPLQWPAFVFDEEIRGWLRACGQAVADPQAVARACASVSPAQALKPADLSLQGALSSAALARSAGLPLTLGGLWQWLPLVLGFAGMLALVQGAALALSEALLFRTFNPSGLRSWRLAMARLALVLAVAGLVTLGPAPMSLAPLEASLALVAGLALAGWAWAGLRPARPPMREKMEETA